MTVASFPKTGRILKKMIRSWRTRTVAVDVTSTGLVVKTPHRLPGGKGDVIINEISRVTPSVCCFRLNEGSFLHFFFFYQSILKNSQSSNSTRSICSKLAGGVKAASSHGTYFPQGSVEARPQRDPRLELLQVVRHSIPSLSPEV